MDNTQKQILKDISNRLDSSTKTPWSTGDFELWTKYANRMKTTIETVSPILITIANGVAEQPKAISNEEVTHLRWMYERLIGVHEENPNYDYMHKMKLIIDKLA